MAAVKALLFREHVHGAALALGVASTAPGQLGHDAARFHAGSKHVTMGTVGSDDLIAFLQRCLHANNNGFLTDVEMAEAADETHTIKLTGLFFETADQQHLTIGGQFLLLVEVCRRRCLGGCNRRRLHFAGRRPFSPRCHISLP
ncbi:hypothetical protein D9M72_548930 [compost metagenome]